MSKLEESAFGLSGHELQQIRYLETLKRRKKQQDGKRFSDGLSVEAQIAMQQALEDSQSPEDEGPSKSKDTRAGQNPERARGNKAALKNGAVKDGGVKTHAAASELGADKCAQSVSFADLFEQKTSRRMSDDITVGGRSSESGSRHALGGGKLPNAMEIIEFVNHDEPAAEEDDAAIEELARINSTEKCQVWMEATEHRDRRARRATSPVFNDDSAFYDEQREMES